MPKQFLERCERHVRFCHTSAEGMTELMAGDMDSRFLAIGLQNKLDASDRESFAMLGNENRPITNDRAAGEPLIECG